MKSISIVWFKRDLRVQDHAALSKAASLGPVLPLYLVEPDLWRQPDLSRRQYDFASDCVQELDRHLSMLGQALIVRVGDVVEVLSEMATKFKIQTIWAHQETWNDWTYKRDLAVHAWCAEHLIKFHEVPQHGVVRRLKNRDSWAKSWHDLMYKPLVQAPADLEPVDCDSESLPSADDLGLRDDNCVQRQIGGRQRAERALQSFLTTRGENYSREMSSPLVADLSCSRLSPHLAFGTISVREVFQAAERRAQELANLPSWQRGKWGSATRSFLSRLRWHCHFIQKLEDDPGIEFENMHSAYDGLRENEFNVAYFEAWKSGHTGYPLVDACMRSLAATGWLTFRMRSMVMSFAAYHLWLHWREPALYLAAQFIDYEPGIHFSQVQMQSGTTGINSVRIYNPVKQSVDQDPMGIFIRQWVPELADMPEDYIHEPWKCPSLMGTYPLPIVEEKAARKSAADRVYGVRQSSQHRLIAKTVLEKHGSRRPRLARKGRAKKQMAKQADASQGELPL